MKKRNPRRCLKCPRKTVARHLELCQPCFAEKTIEAILDYWYPLRSGKDNASKKGRRKPQLIHPVCAICFDRLKSDVCSPCYGALYENKIDTSKFWQDCHCRGDELEQEEEEEEKDGKCVSRTRRK
jgi:hypothetical protein